MFWSSGRTIPAKLQLLTRYWWQFENSGQIGHGMGTEGGINSHLSYCTKTQTTTDVTMASPIIIMSEWQSSKENLLSIKWITQTFRHYDPRWKRNPNDHCGRVTFWDTRGFDLIFDKDKASLLMRYILEGRLSHHNFNQALIQSTVSGSISAKAFPCDLFTVSVYSKMIIKVII